MERMKMRGRKYRGRILAACSMVVVLLSACTIEDIPLRDTLLELGYYWEQALKVEATTPLNPDQFGRSVAVYGDWAAVGANEESAYKGAVYIYHKSSSGWSPSQKIPGGSADDILGTSVAIYGDFLLIGAPGVSSNAGRAYVYQLSSGTWTLLRTLESPVVDGAGLFGMSVALTDQYAFIGAPYHGAGEGRVYAFYRNEGGADMWGAPGSGQTLSRAAPAAKTMGDYFGSSVAASGDYAVVGIPESSLVPPSGGASIFHLSGGTWSQTAALVSDNPAFDYFGSAVSISGDVAAVGAPDEEAVYVFTRNGSDWSGTVLRAPDEYAGSEYGTAVAISGSLLLVGAPADATEGTRAGRVFFYRFDSSSWVRDGTLVATDGEAGAELGFFAAMDGDHALAAAPGNTTPDLPGAVYFLERVR